jgi:pimeloyl-ACP methyl ester carboxylesterase
VPLTTGPLVLLPGLLCDAGVWEPQICSLGEVLAIDYGAADSLSGMAEITLREAPAQFALAGHSMGGRVAPEVAPMQRMYCEPCAALRCY